MKEKKVLVVDSSTLSRKNTVSCLLKAGFQESLIFESSSYEHFQTLAPDLQPDIIISELKIEGGSCFDLFRDSRNLFENIVVVLTTALRKFGLEGQIVEENVDGVILKPYKNEVFSKNLKEIIHLKEFRSDDQKKIDLCYKNIKDKDKNALQKNLSSLNLMTDRPSLYYFFLGNFHLLDHNDSKAQESFELSIKKNPKHFNALSSLFDLYMKRGDFKKAERLASDFLFYYPINQDRLSKFIHLAVRNEHYDHILRYYETFLKISQKTEFLKTYMGAGLFIGGKFKLLKHEKKAALEYFRRIEDSCQHPKLSHAIDQLLFEYGVDQNLYKNAA